MQGRFGGRGGKLTPIFLFLVFFAGKLRMSARVQKKTGKRSTVNITPLFLFSVLWAFEVVESFRS